MTARDRARRTNKGLPDRPMAGIAIVGAACRLPGAPDNVNLEHFMDIIDPPAATAGLRVLPWLRELSRSHVAGV